MLKYQNGFIEFDSSSDICVIDEESITHFYKETTKHLNGHNLNGLSMWLTIKCNFLIFTSIGSSQETCAISYIGQNRKIK